MEYDCCEVKWRKQKFESLVLKLNGKKEKQLFDPHCCAIVCYCETVLIITSHADITGMITSVATSEINTDVNLKRLMVIKLD